MFKSAGFLHGLTSGWFMHVCSMEVLFVCMCFGRGGLYVCMYVCVGLLCAQVSMYCVYACVSFVYVLSMCDCSMNMFPCVHLTV